MSPRAFTVPEGAKKGENTGEIGIEGTAIEEPEEVGGARLLPSPCLRLVLLPLPGCLPRGPLYCGEGGGHGEFGIEGTVVEEPEEASSR